MLCNVQHTHTHTHTYKTKHVHIRETYVRHRLGVPTFGILILRGAAIGLNIKLGLKLRQFHIHDVTTSLVFLSRPLTIWNGNKRTYTHIYIRQTYVRLQPKAGGSQARRMRAAAKPLVVL